MERKSLVLTNSYHGTATTVNIERHPNYLTRAQVTRARQKLCGSDCCACAEDIVGTSGMEGVYFHDYGDGSASIVWVNKKGQQHLS